MKELKHLEEIQREPMFATRGDELKHQSKCVKIARQLAKAKTDIEKRAIWKVFLAA